MGDESGIEVDDALNETWLCLRIRSRIPLKYFVGSSERKASSSAYDQKRDKLWSILPGLSPEAAGNSIECRHEVSENTFKVRLYITLSSQRHPL
jgi:hypothetical protein